MKKTPLWAAFIISLIALWPGCASISGRNDRLDALIDELAAAPAWSDLREATLASDGPRLVAVCQKTMGLSLQDLRYVEFHYLERFEIARMRMIPVLDTDGTSHQRPIAVINMDPQKKAAYRQAWSKLHVLHRIYFAVPDQRSERPVTGDSCRNCLYPLERRSDGSFEITHLLGRNSLVDTPRAEFADLAYTYGSRQSGEKVRYDY